MKSRNHQSIYPGSSWLFVFILTTILFIGLGNAPIAEDNQAQIMSGGVSEEIDCNHNPAGLPHSPITIDGNQNFSDTASLEGWPGDGSQSTPYIIEGFDIGVGGPSGYCIDIRNTDVYFEIRSCFLTGASAGIYLAATSNGLLADNICSGNFYGIYNTAAHYNTMQNNTCRNNGYGMYIRQSRSITVSKNNCSDNSEYGIYLWGSSNTNSIVQHNFCLNNTESGIYSYYAHNPSYINNTCNLNQKSGIHYEIGNDPIFTNNTCNRNTLHGIFLDSFGLTNHFVRNNTCGYNGDRGILALELWDGEIVGNICFNNTYGVTLMTSDSVTMTSNTLTGNDIGVSLDSSSDSNSFNWNAIRFCTVEDAQDDGTGNDFDYNYWSNYTGVDVNMDGFGDTPYFIGGTTVSQDSHPLILPPDRPPITWDETPTNQTILEIDDFNYDLDATALASIDVWKVNDTDNFYIDTMGVVRNATILNPDIFGMQVWVNDTYGNVLSAIFSITVLDATPPEWTITPGDQTIEYGYPLVCEFNASDLSGLDMWFVNDTAHFAIDQSGILRNATVILPGIYGCEVSVNDTLGNTKTTILIMTIQSSAPPTWVESPVDRIVEYNDIFSYNLDATDISGLGVWWINDTVNFAIDQEGTIINVTSLSVATYGIMVYVSDSLGNILNNAFQVRIQDTTPPDWIETPEDQFVEYGDTYVCDFNATDLSGIDDWWVDDTIRFTIDYAGRIRTVTILEPGIYGLQVWVSDIYGNELTVTFDVEIADTTPPEWIDDPIDQFLEFGESLSYRLEATDLSSINDWALNDTERFTISNNGLITNVASLEAGHYGLQVSVSDPYGNALTATFIVHVGAVTTTTSTTTTTTDPTTTSNDTASIQIEPLLLVAVGGGIVIVAVIAFIVLKRR